MLVLSRKVGEKIHVGDDIVLEVRRISGNRVTLAFNAPRSVRILRGELERTAQAPETARGTPPVAAATSKPTAPWTIIGHLATHSPERDFVI